MLALSLTSFTITGQIPGPIQRYLILFQKGPVVRYYHSFLFFVFFFFFRKRHSFLINTCFVKGCFVGSVVGESVVHKMTNLIASHIATIRRQYVCDFVQAAEWCYEDAFGVKSGLNSSSAISFIFFFLILRCKLLLLM